MQVTPPPFWFISGPYTTGNYTGLYYLDYGEYPQTQETNADIIAGISGEPVEKGYYVSSVNGEKYERKGTSPNFTYYLVEPVRWLIIGNGDGLNDMGFPNINANNELESNQLLLLSKDLLVQGVIQSGYNNTSWKNTNMYKNILNPLQNKIFNLKELEYLYKIYDEDYKLSLLSNSLSFKYSNYLSSASLKCIYTSYCGECAPHGAQYTSYIGYWLKGDTFNGSEFSGRGNNVGYFIHRNTGARSSDRAFNSYGVRPIIVVNI